MSSVLTHSRLPQWAYIVIIAVGSVLVLAVLLIIWKCWYIRTAKGDGFPYENSQTPTRRVTIRRGRVIPTSHYLSLTGSKFGLGQFNNIEENKGEAKGRSKSPFEWWATIKDRSQSAQSEMIQSGPSRSRNQVYTPDTLEAGPRRFNGGFSSEPRLPTFTRSQAMAENSQTSLPTMPSSAAQRPSRHTNFSRSFVSQRNTATWSPSPSRQSRHFDQASVQLGSDSRSIGSDKAASFVSAHEVLEPDLSPSPTPTAQQTPGNTQSFLNSAAAASTTSAWQPDMSRQISKPRSESALRNEYRRGSHSSPYRSSSILEQDTSVTRNSSHVSRTLPSKSFEMDRGHSQYWNTRPDLMPIRKPSKKRNTLRKKSLRRAEVASWV
jgi:hypothetical protein